MLDLELDREACGRFGSNTCASTSGLVWALGVADQSLAGAIVVCNGGGDAAL